MWWCWAAGHINMERHVAEQSGWHGGEVRAVISAPGYDDPAVVLTGGRCNLTALHLLDQGNPERIGCLLPYSRITLGPGNRNKCGSSCFVFLPVITGCYFISSIIRQLHDLIQTSCYTLKAPKKIGAFSCICLGPESNPDYESGLSAGTVCLYRGIWSHLISKIYQNLHAAVT